MIIDLLHLRMTKLSTLIIVQNVKLPRVALFLLLAVTISIGGCAETATIPTTDGATAISSATPSAFAQFPDIAVPPNTKINVDNTLIVGSKPWFGRLALESFTSASRAFDFFLNNMGNHGWERKQAVRGPTYILTYNSAEREMTVIISSRTLAGSEITITVSPRDQTQLGKPQVNNMPSAGTQ